MKSVTDVRDRSQMVEAIKAVIASKQYGYEDLLCGLVVDACLTTLPVQSQTKRPMLNIDNVRVAKLRGGSIPQSTSLKGMVVLRDAEGFIKRAENCKVVVFGCGIEATASEAKATVMLSSAEALMNYNKSEERKMEEIIAGIASTGAKVVISHGSISEMAMHFLDKFGLLVVKIQSKFDLRRICSALGAKACVRLGPCTPEELGECTL